MKDRIVSFGKDLFQQFQEDDVTGIGAELAYRFLFAIFPFAIFMAALGAFVAQWVGIGNPTDEIMNAISDNLPAQVAAQIRPQLEQVIGTTRPGLLSFGAVAALWAATGGTSSLMKAMNRAYDVEETRSIFAKYGMALGLTLLATAGILVSFVSIVGGSVLTEQVATQLGITGSAWTAITLLRWPVVLILLGVAVGVLFRLAPNIRVPLRYTMIGGFLFAVLWIVATAAFALYVANFGNYANTYGALGGVIILMLWFYITGVVLILCAEVVAIIVDRKEPERVEQRRRETKAEAAGKQVKEHAGRGARKAKEAAQGAMAAVDDGGGEAGEGQGERRGDRDRRGRAPDARRERERGASGAPGPARFERRPRIIAGSTAWTGRGAEADQGGSPLLAAVIVGGGAIVGAVVGLLTGRGAEES